MTDPEPQVLSTTTAASPTPIADSIQAPDSAPEEPQAPTTPSSETQYHPDVNAMNGAHGDLQVWAHQFHELIGYATGASIDEGSLEDLFETFSNQISQQVYRSVLFTIANSQVPPDLPGDPALSLLQFRDDVARGFKHQAGL